MEKNFTHGKWVVQQNDFGSRLIGTHVNRICKTFHDAPEEQVTADTNLICAAPELLAALEDLIERADRARSILQTPDSGSHHGYWGVLDTENAKQIIKKAYGEQ